MATDVARFVSSLPQLLNDARTALSAGKRLLAIWKRTGSKRIDEQAGISNYLSWIRHRLAPDSDDDPDGGHIPVFERTEFHDWLVANEDLRVILTELWDVKVSTNESPDALLLSLEGFSRLVDLLAGWIDKSGQLNLGPLSGTRISVKLTERLLEILTTVLQRYEGIAKSDGYQNYPLSPDVNSIDAATTYLVELGFSGDADRLRIEYDRFKECNKRLMLMLLAEEGSPEQVERYRELFGPLPLPPENEEEKKQFREDVQLAIAGTASNAAETILSLIPHVEKLAASRRGGTNETTPVAVLTLENERHPTEKSLEAMQSPGDDGGAAGKNAAEAGGDRSPSIIRPPNNAFIAWRLRDLMNITNQTEIAEKMTEQGHPASQGQVSRWLTQVKEYLKAGNVLPDIPAEGLKQKPEAIDPSVIEMGARQDGQTPRQRQRRSEDSDD